MTSMLARIPWHTWRPKLVDALATYDRRTLLSDVVAGLTVGVVALPLAMAFGIASGVTPQAGIYTAIVGGVLVSLLGGSRIQIGGPTGAFVVIVAGIIAAHGLSGPADGDHDGGCHPAGPGGDRSGTAVKFIPRPVVVGFTNGIALLIASTQIKDFLGLGIADPPSEFFARMRVLVESMPTMDVLRWRWRWGRWPSCCSSHVGCHECLDRLWPSCWARSLSSRFSCRSTRLDRGLVAFRVACPRSPFPHFVPT